MYISMYSRFVGFKFDPAQILPTPAVGGWWFPKSISFFAFWAKKPNPNQALNKKPNPNPTPTPTASPTQHTAKWGLCDELQQDDHHPAVWCYGTCDLFGRSHYSSSTTSHGKFDDDLHLGDQGWSQTEGMKKKFMILICTHYIYIDIITDVLCIFV